MFEELNKIPHADEARYDSRRQGAPVRCLANTRTEVLNRIQRWITPLTQAAATEPTSDTSGDSSSDTAVEPIYWVNGLAGIGKSTIARTVAEDNHNLLGASFFFSRQEKGLSNADLFIPTIAYQLARSYREARSVIIKVFRHEPDIGKRPFAMQVKELIIEPLSKITSKPVIIVVDALDECDNSKGAANELLRAVVEHCTKSPSLRLLITSRPELYIKRVLTNTARIVLHEDINRSIISNDIRTYLREEMSQIPKRLDVKVSLPWPSERKLGVLVEKAGKLFIWAAMAVRFVGDDRGTDPISRLETLLHESISPGSNPGNRNPYKDLDRLYMAILSQTAEGLESDSVNKLQKVIGTVIRLRSEMPLDSIADFLGEREIVVKMALNRIQSIIPIPTDLSQPIQIYHPSFPDFITSRERCPDSLFYVDSSIHERRLALQCLDILNNQLSEYIETLLKPTVEVSSVPREALLRTIPLKVQYACQFWAIHITFSSMDNSDDKLMEWMDLFSSTMLLRWVVTMCILDALSETISATRSMQQWIVSLASPVSISSINSLAG